MPCRGRQEANYIHLFPESSRSLSLSLSLSRTPTLVIYTVIIRMDILHTHVLNICILSVDVLLHQQACPRKSLLLLFFLPRPIGSWLVMVHRWSIVVFNLSLSFLSLSLNPDLPSFFAKREPGIRNSGEWEKEKEKSSMTCIRHEWERKKESDRERGEGGRGRASWVVKKDFFEGKGAIVSIYYKVKVEGIHGFGGGFKRQRKKKRGMRGAVFLACRMMIMEALSLLFGKMQK